MTDSQPKPDEVALAVLENARRARDALMAATIGKGYENTDVDGACAALGQMCDVFRRDQEDLRSVGVLDGEELEKRLKHDAIVANGWWSEGPRKAGPNYYLAGPHCLYPGDTMNGWCYRYDNCLVRPLRPEVEAWLQAKGFRRVWVVGGNGHHLRVSDQPPA